MQITLSKCFSWLLLLGITKPAQGRALIGEYSDVKKLEYEKDFPFVVSIAATGDFDNNFLHECTGTLITDKLVLTAAHCLDDRDAGDLQVFVGSNDLRNVEAFGIESWIVYCMWYILRNSVDCKGPANDIAIIQLGNEKKPRVRPAILSYVNKSRIFGSKVFTVGWGSTEAVAPTNELKIAPLKVISDCSCQSRLKKIGASAAVTPQFMCSMAKANWTLIDDGDSGGPLMTEDFAVVGVNKAVIPNTHHAFLPEEAVRKLESNLHMSLHAYEDFIEEIKRVGVTNFLRAHKSPWRDAFPRVNILA